MNCSVFSVLISEIKCVIFRFRSFISRSVFSLMSCSSFVKSSIDFCWISSSFLVFALSSLVFESRWFIFDDSNNLSVIIWFSAIKFAIFSIWSSGFDDMLSIDFLL